MNMAGDEIRLAGLQDLDGIMALEKAGFSRGWSAKSWAEEISDHYVVVAGDGLGVIAMSAVAGTVELLRVIVAPQAQGRGLGRALVSHGLEWAEHFGATDVFLEVSASNQAAIQLYESCGFTPLDRRTDYYGPGDDALVYRRVIQPPAGVGQTPIDVVQAPVDVVLPPDVILTQSGSPSHSHGTDSSTTPEETSCPNR